MECLCPTAPLKSRTIAVFAWTFECTDNVATCCEFRSTLCRCNIMTIIVFSVLVRQLTISKLFLILICIWGLFRFAAARDPAHERGGLSRAHLLWRSISWGEKRESPACSTWPQHDWIVMSLLTSAGDSSEYSASQVHSPEFPSTYCGGTLPSCYVLTDMAKCFKH